jgi:DNA-binding response OmpR family regulator
MAMFKYPIRDCSDREDGMIITKDTDHDTSCDVLVIDDDVDILYLLIAHLTSRGIHAKGMTSGKDLPEVLASVRPRLVLLDVMMPVFNGYALYEAIKNEMALGGTSVYFISALPEQDLSWHVEQSGAAGYVAKPFTIADIDAILAAAGFAAAI